MSENRSVRVRLEVPSEYVSRAAYAWEELAVRAGLPIAWVGPGEAADLTYGAAVSSGSGAGKPARDTVLPFDPRMFDQNTPCAAVQGRTGRRLWSAAEDSDPEVVDLAGSAYRLLTLMDEAQVPEGSRDRRGAFLTTALPSARSATCGEPLVENLADELRGRVARVLPGIDSLFVPRWPAGKSCAVVLTHDADAMHLGAPFELAHNLAKALRRGGRDPWELVVNGIRFFGRKSANPLFGFPKWRDWESSWRIRSAFYLYYRPSSVRRDRDDCRSGVAGGGTDWAVLREMSEQGWEFGLHPSIHVKSASGAFGRSREWLEEALGRPVQGIRHHFWALDWRRPWKTHRQHAEAGFRHDSSIAWRERAGYRAGTSLPYPSFDRETGEPVPLMVVPCTLMDRHVLFAGPGGGRLKVEDSVELGRRFILEAKERGGAVVLNWHQETVWNRSIYRDYHTVLDQIMKALQGDSSVWWTTPGELLAHWSELRRGIVRR